MQKKPILISEIITNTLQGEGPFVGNPSLFIRTAVCSLFCTWCDTKDSWNITNKKNWDAYTFEKLKKYCSNFITPEKDIVITGGEPLLWKNNVHFLSLIDYFLGYGNKVIIETNGTTHPPVVQNKEKLWISCSPKLSNSGVAEKQRYKISVLKFIAAHNYSYFKFVVDSPKDIQEIKDKYSFIPVEKIWLMPCANTKEEMNKKEKEIALCALENNFRYSTRLHLQLNLK